MESTSTFLKIQSLFIEIFINFFFIKRNIIWFGRFSQCFLFGFPFPSFFLSFFFSVCGHNRLRSCKYGKREWTIFMAKPQKNRIFNFEWLAFLSIRMQFAKKHFHFTLHHIFNSIKVIKVCLKWNEGTQLRNTLYTHI